VGVRGPPGGRTWARSRIELIAFDGSRLEKPESADDRRLALVLNRLLVFPRMMSLPGVELVTLCGRRRHAELITSLG